MSSTTISTLYKAYTELEDKNASALEELAHLNTGSDLPHHFYALFNRLRGMANSVRTLLTAKSPHYQGMDSGDYSTALEKKIDSVYGDYHRRPLFRTAFETGRSLSPSVRDEIMRSTFSDAVALNPCLNGSFSDGGVSLDDLQTPHDLIRYLHQVGVDLFFDLNREDISWYDLNNGFSYGMKSLRVTGMYVGEKGGESVLSEDPFIKRLKLLSLSEKLKPKFASVDNLHVLVSDDRLSIQSPLGAHFASLKIKYTNESYDFTFFFRNTRTYNSSAFRDHVTDAVLRRLGYDVTVDAGKHTATCSIEKRERAAANRLELLVRFMVSLSDVDLCETERVKNREKDTANAFFAGVINLYDYICNHPPGTYVTYAQSKGTYLGRKKKSPSKKKVLKTVPSVGDIGSVVAAVAIEAVPRVIEPTLSKILIPECGRKKDFLENKLLLPEAWDYEAWDYTNPYFEHSISSSYKFKEKSLNLQRFRPLRNGKTFTASSKLGNYLINQNIDYSKVILFLKEQKGIVELGAESVEKEDVENTAVSSEAVGPRGEPDENH